MNKNTPKDSHYARLRRQHRDKISGNHGNKRQYVDFQGEQPPSGRIRLYGFHAVEAALDNPRRVLHRLFLSANAYERLKKDRNAARALSSPSANNRITHYRHEQNSEADWASDLRLSLPIQRIEPKDLAKILGSAAVHQGIALETEPLPPQRRGDFADSSLVLLLDQVTDPHNVGAIMRSAAAFNVDFLITTARHSPQETGVLAKSASGALEKIDLVTVRNLAETLETLNKAGFQTIGLDSEGEKTVESCMSGQKIALVLGAEGKGLRQKTRQFVSDLARLNMPGAIKSLNVSNAAAITLYAAHQYLKNVKI